MKNSLFCIPLLITCFSAVSQSRQTVKGKVVSDFDDLDGIHVINRATEAAVLTTRGGYFSIDAAPGDTLIFSSIQFESAEVVIHESGFRDNLLFVPLKVHTRNLDELVIVDYSYINAVSLGLVKNSQIRYTPAEKKYATASKWKMNPLGLDPLINLFSGRTAVLKKAAETEKKEQLMEKIGYIYTEEDIVAVLKIPEEYVRGFVFYAVENKYFVKAISEKNMKMARFLLNGLAVKYNELIDDEE